MAGGRALVGASCGTISGHAFRPGVWCTKFLRHFAFSFCKRRNLTKALGWRVTRGAWGPPAAPSWFPKGRGTLDAIPFSKRLSIRSAELVDQPCGVQEWSKSLGRRRGPARACTVPSSGRQPVSANPPCMSAKATHIPCLAVGRWYKLFGAPCVVQGASGSFVRPFDLSVRLIGLCGWRVTWRMVVRHYSAAPGV